MERALLLYVNKPLMYLCRKQKIDRADNTPTYPKKYTYVYVNWPFEIKQTLFVCIDTLT